MVHLFIYQAKYLRESYICEIPQEHLKEIEDVEILSGVNVKYFYSTSPLLANYK